MLHCRNRPAPRPAPGATVDRRPAPRPRPRDCRTDPGSAAAGRDPMLPVNRVRLDAVCAWQDCRPARLLPTTPRHAITRHGSRILPGTLHHADHVPMQPRAYTRTPWGEYGGEGALPFPGHIGKKFNKRPKYPYTHAIPIKYPCNTMIINMIPMIPVKTGVSDSACVRVRACARVCVLV
jgi:hypothetical protein